MEEGTILFSTVSESRTRSNWVQTTREEISDGHQEETPAGQGSWAVEQIAKGGSGFSLTGHLKAKAQ